MSAQLMILLGGIIGIGFLASMLFERTKLPEALFLLGVGITLGPALRMVSVDSVRPLMSSFSSIALTIILFEGALGLDARSSFRQTGRALVLAAFSFGVTIFLVHYALVLGLNASGLGAWALSAALSCTSAHIVVPVANRLISGSPLRSLLSVESSFSDAIAVLTVLVLAGLDAKGADSASFLVSVGYPFLIGGGIALAAGVFWLWLLSRLYSSSAFYLMTVGFVFLLMGTVEAVHGSGAFAVFLFGLVLGNGETLLLPFPTRFRVRLRSLFADGKISLHPRISETHAEFSFLIRSFFFVYLGVAFQWPGSDFRLWLAFVLVLAAVLVGRELAVQLTGWTARIPAPQRNVLGAMIPRGLATVVLSTMIVSYSAEMSASFSGLTVFIVMATNLWMAVRLSKIPEFAPAGKQET